MTQQTLPTLRPLRATDSLDDITRLLHRAYASLGAMGLNYTAVDQTPAMTLTRVQRGQCFVVDDALGQLLGTITVNSAFDPNTDPWARATPWYYRQDVAHLHQFAVEPSLQGKGLGDQLLGAVEQWASARGHCAIALDTAIPATHLRAFYGKRGYENVDEVQWGGKRYRSVVMVKSLSTTPPSVTDLEHRCAKVRTYWAHVQARDWVSMRSCLSAQATMEWPCTNERFLDGEAIVRVNQIYPEGWTIKVMSVDGLADKRVLSVVQVSQDSQVHFANSFWTFGPDGLITNVQEYWGAAEAPPSWRTPEAIGAYQRLPKQL